MGRHAAQPTAMTELMEKAREALTYHQFVEDHPLQVSPTIAGADDDLTLAPDTTKVLD